MLSIVESSTNYMNISVISDDTDIFVLLVHFYHDRQLTWRSCPVTMEATSKERKFIDIQATAHLHNSRISLVNYQQLMLCRGATLWLNCGELEKTRVMKDLGGQL